MKQILTALLLAGFCWSALAQTTFKADRSSVIKAYIYYAEKQELSIYLADGTQINYAKVPAKTYQGLLDAPLKGGYYKAFIRDSFPKQEITKAKASKSPKE